MRVNEIFGPTIQGEGPRAGRRSVFLRVAGCNLDCKWCDTPYTWDWFGKNGVAFDREAETHEMATEDIIRTLLPLARGALNLVVTGGEPLIQSEAVEELARYWLRSQDTSVEIETNGTRPPLQFMGNVGGDRLHYNVSPKLPSSGVEPSKAWHYDTLAYFARATDAVFKFVIQNQDDLLALDQLLDIVALPRHRVWLMPEGKQTFDLVNNFQWVADEAVERGFNVSTRLHVMAWGDQRGV